MLSGAWTARGVNLRPFSAPATGKPAGLLPADGHRGPYQRPLKRRRDLSVYSGGPSVQSPTTQNLRRGARSLVGQATISFHSNGWRQRHLKFRRRLPARGAAPSRQLTFFHPFPLRPSRWNTAATCNIAEIRENNRVRQGGPPTANINTPPPSALQWEAIWVLARMGGTVAGKRRCSNEPQTRACGQG